jgi:hypothetical protein
VLRGAETFRRSRELSQHTIPVGRECFFTLYIRDGVPIFFVGIFSDVEGKIAGQQKRIMADISRLEMTPILGGKMKKKRVPGTTIPFARETLKREKYRAEKWQNREEKVSPKNDEKVTGLILPERTFFEGWAMSCWSEKRLTMER